MSLSRLTGNGKQSRPDQSPRPSRDEPPVMNRQQKTIPVLESDPSHLTMTERHSDGITFKVFDVAQSTAQLASAPAESVVTHRCGGVTPEARSSFPGNIVKEMRGLSVDIGIDNGLISAIHSAWSNHCPLVLTPDMIWLAIAQGFANHVNENAEKLRHLLVEHEGRKTLEVRRDDFVKGSPNNPWPEAFDSFSEQIRRNVGDKTHSTLTPTFSTTGPVERAAAQVVLMNTFKQYFVYEMICICGIPEITIEGTPEDWALLRDKALSLAEFDLHWWTDHLKPILSQFVAASSGTIDTFFWRRIYHHYGSEGYAPGPFVTGWVLALFPYVGGRELSRNKFLDLWQRKEPSSHQMIGNAFHFGAKANDVEPGVYHNCFPPGVVSTPFIWKGLCGETAMNFFAGFMAVSQDPASLALRPEIGWAVADEKTLEDAKERSLQHRW